MTDDINIDLIDELKNDFNQNNLEDISSKHFIKKRTMKNKSLNQFVY